MLNGEKKKVVPKLRQKVKVDIVTSDDIKIYYTRKFQDFTVRYIIDSKNVQCARTITLFHLIIELKYTDLILNHKIPIFIDFDEGDGFYKHCC